MIQAENGLPAHKAPDNWVRRLTEPLPEIAVQWRRGQGKPNQRDGKWYAQFIAYVDADTVRERLDSVVPGDWDLTLETLEPYTITDKDGKATGTMFTVKARLQVLGVVRENLGQSDKDWKAAATDAFKRAAARFGIGHELGTAIYKNVWVQIDGDGKYAKLVGDPAAILKAKQARLTQQGQRSEANRGGAQAPARPQSASAGQERSPAAPPATPLKNGPTPMAARPSGRDF